MFFPSCDFLMCSVCVSDLAFSFARFSYAFSLCLGPGIFLRAIFLGILAVFLTWHFASREFLISRPCILHHVIFSRVMVVPVRSIFERFGAFAPKMYMCLSAWAHTLFIYLSASAHLCRKCSDFAFSFGRLSLHAYNASDVAFLFGRFFLLGARGS